MPLSLYQLMIPVTTGIDTPVFEDHKGNSTRTGRKVLILGSYEVLQEQEHVYCFVVLV